MGSPSSIVKNSLGLPAVGSTLVGMAVSSDGRWLWLAHASDGLRPAHDLINEADKLNVALWDLGTNQLLGSMVSPPVASPELVAVGNTRRVLVAHDSGGWLLDLDSGKATEFPLLGRDILYGPPHIDAAAYLATVRVSDRDVPTLARVDLDLGSVALTLSPADAPFAGSADGKWLCYLVRSEAGSSIRIVEARHGTIVADSPVLEGLYSIKALAIAENGRTVACFSDTKVGIWRIGEEVKTQTLTSFGSIEFPALAFAPDGRTLYCLTRGSIGQLHIVDTEHSQAEMEQIANEMEYGEGLDESDLIQGVRMVAISASGMSAFAATYEELLHFALGGQDAVRSASAPAIDCIAVLPELGWIATSSRRSSEIACRVPGNDTPVQQFDAACGGVRELHAGPDGASLYIVGMDGSLSHFAPARTPPLVRWACPYVATSKFTFEPGGRRVACTHGPLEGSRGMRSELPPEEQGTITVWDIDSGRMVADLNVDIDAPPVSMAWLRGKPDVLRTCHGILTVDYDAKSGARLGSGSFPIDWVASSPDPQILPNGKGVITMHGSQLVVWELGTGRVAVDLGAAEGTHLLAIDPEGHRAVLTTREHGVAIHSLVSDNGVDAKLNDALDQEPIIAAAWSPDGNQLALVTLSQRIVLVET